MSVMRRFQERVRNEGKVIAAMPQAKKSAGPSGLLAGGQLEALVTASLAEDLAALSALTSVERKIAMKRDTLLPKYGDYVARLMAAGSRHELLGYWLVWLFDAGKIPDALGHGLWCLEAGIALPERFRSDIRYFISVQVIEWAEAEFTAGRSPEPYLSDQYRRQTADAESWNLPDDLSARYSRLRGLMAEKDGNLALAEAELQTALSLGAKVKTALDRVRKNIKDSGMQSGEAGDESPAQPDGQGGGESPAPDKDE